MPLAHTPYDGSSRMFTIGLKPLDPSTWIEVDEHYRDHLIEKQRVYATIPDLVFVEEEETRAAQREVLEMLVAHLGEHADRLSADDEWRRSLPARLAAARDSDDLPLRTASLLVQEDLILMRRGEAGWRLAAGALCFPSSWSLIEKFGRPMHEIHRPVPGFGPGTRNADLIARMFDNLKVDRPVERFNWSIQDNDELYHPLSNSERDVRSNERPAKFTDDNVARQARVRVERQTLRKLPLSGDILFTIRIHLDPVAMLARRADRQSVAASFAEQLLELDEAQLDYKGLTADRDRLVAALRRIAAS